jgi:hypothetical protein
VQNPNFFAATFQKISATAYYPIGNVDMGGGEKDDITFPSNSETTFSFPLSIVYTEVTTILKISPALIDQSQDKDPNRTIVNDIANRCGFNGATRQQIIVKYEIILEMRILVFSISPSFTGSAGFDCPLTQAQIEVSVDNDVFIIILLIIILLAVPGKPHGWWIIRIISFLYNSWTFEMDPSSLLIKRNTR